MVEIPGVMAARSEGWPIATTIHREMGTTYWPEETDAIKNPPSSGKISGEPS